MKKKRRKKNVLSKCFYPKYARISFNIKTEANKHSHKIRDLQRM